MATPAVVGVRGPVDAMQCPWCAQYAQKDAGCNHVVCGRDAAGFTVGGGCGRQWCYACGGRLCGLAYDPASGAPRGASEAHSATCCLAEAADPTTWEGAGWCPGGHNAHAAPRAMPRATPSPGTQ